TTGALGGTVLLVGLLVLFLALLMAVRGSWDNLVALAGMAMFSGLLVLFLGRIGLQVAEISRRQSAIAKTVNLSASRLQPRLTKIDYTASSLGRVAPQIQEIHKARINWQPGIKPAVESGAAYPGEA